MTAKERLASLAEIGVEPVVEARSVLARLETLDLPPFVPHTPPAHRPTVTEEGSEAAHELESLVPLALEAYRDVLLQPTSFDDLDFAKLKIATAANVINATLKVDEGRLKRRKLDILPKLLEIISQEERTMAGKLIEAA